jgi:hypothetical protein
MEAGSFGECPEVAVSREKRNAAVNATLGDQGITEVTIPPPAANSLA